MEKLALCLLLALCWALPAPADPMHDQAAEFHRLRQIKGHFQGGPEWIPDVDSWGGKKHQAMNRLQKALGPGTPEADVLKLLEAPDETAKPGSLKWAFVRPRQGDSMLIYQWRGGHDFLYFLIEKKTVIQADWWMAGE
jgi:hypothetical protein